MQQGWGLWLLEQGQEKLFPLTANEKKRRPEREEPGLSLAQRGRTTSSNLQRSPETSSLVPGCWGQRHCAGGVNKSPYARVPKIPAANATPAAGELTARGHARAERQEKEEAEHRQEPESRTA